ncbi:MAG: hypothetical protein M3P82_00225 [Bacteroidota bacterium]|nr:hypothetical protein [Bacteroidota bacterium]
MKNLVFIICLVLIITGCSKKENTDEINVKRNTSEEHVEDGNMQSDDSSKRTSSDGYSPLKKITSNQVKHHVGDSLLIEGYVADIYLSEKVAYLNFGNKFPKNNFTCTIFSGKIEEFGDLSKFKGRNVLVNGKITSYKNKPQVVLNSKDQIKILN